MTSNITILMFTETLLNLGIVSTTYDNNGHEIGGGNTILSLYTNLNDYWGFMSYE